MLKIFTAQDMFRLQLVRNQLDFCGIETVVRNEFSGGAMGDLSFIDCWPELWLVNAHQLERARAIVRNLQPVDQPEGPDHLCTYCGQTSPSNFERCWQCQTPLTT